MIPYIFSTIEIVCGFQLPTLLTILLQISNLHSFFNVVAMIMLLKPYRKAIIYAIKLNCIANRQQPNVQEVRQRPASVAQFAPAKLEIQLVKRVNGKVSNKNGQRQEMFVENYF